MLYLLQIFDGACLAGLTGEYPLTELFIAAAQQFLIVQLSGGLGFAFELGRLDRHPDFGPVERVIETDIAGGVALFGQCALQQCEMSLRRTFAQHGELQAIKRIEQAPAFSQGSVASLGTADALKRKQCGKP